MKEEYPEKDKPTKTKWLQILGIALSLPSTIFVVAYFSMQLVEKKIVSQTIGVFIFLSIIIYLLFMMVWIAMKKK